MDAFESAGAGLALTTLDGRCLRINEAFRALLNLSVEAPTLLPLADVVNPLDQPKLHAAIPMQSPSGSSLAVGSRPPKRRLPSGSLKVLITPPQYSTPLLRQNETPAASRRACS